LHSQTATASDPPAVPATNSFIFNADGAQATLVFFDSASNATTSLDGVLDNVSVNASPEPASLALLGIGMGALIGYGRWRRRAPKA
jgi:hypothetical protein